MSNRILVLATRNPGKVDEIQSLLKDYPVEIKQRDDFGPIPAVEEDGQTFEENAYKKASFTARVLGFAALADDSGLAVNALGGAPGVRSARYAGPKTNDHSNNLRLLAELSDTPLEKRTAHYVCHVAVSDPRGELRARCEERCYGRIRYEPAGTHGFGYDPLFEIVEYHRTFGQLGLAVKSAISHRSRALRALLPQLSALVAAGQWT